MGAFPLAILALAAGVLLLIKVKKDGLGKLYSGLGWLVVLLSIGFMVALGIRMWHRHCEKDCHKDGQCTMDKGMAPKADGVNCCDNKDSTCSMGGCHMEGDSMVMDKEAAEKAMGKEAADKLFKEKGRYIMSKEECMKMCHVGGGSCCADKGGETGGHKGACCASHSGCQGDCGGKCESGGCGGKCESKEKSCCKK